MGSRKAAVFPEPVCAAPSTFLPARMGGMQLICTGVGEVMPRAPHARTSQLTTPSVVKVVGAREVVVVVVGAAVAVAVAVAVGSSSSEPSESEESEEVMVVVLEVLRARFLVLPALLVENNCMSGTCEG